MTSVRTLTLILLDVTLIAQLANSAAVSDAIGALS